MYSLTPRARERVTYIRMLPRADLPDVVAKIDAGGFVVVDDPDLAPDHLREPDRGRIADAEVPGRPHQRGRIVGHGSDALFLLSARHQLPVVGADDRGVERAFELLGVLVLAEIALGERELAFGNEAGLARLEHEGKPILFQLRALPQLEEGVAALGRAD